MTHLRSRSLTYNRNYFTALYTWGTGTDGQLGHSKFQLEGILSESYVQTEPRRLIKSKGFTTVAIGGTYTLALNETGHLFAWGDMFGKVKNNTPHALPTDKTFTHLSAGTKHAAAVDIDGQVHTWGSSGDWFYGGGQLGHDNYEALTAPK
jgi:alpha-tubulin suppressor-like RCC1 family protein